MYFQNSTTNPWKCLESSRQIRQFQRGGVKTRYTRLRRKVRATPVKMTGSGDTHSRLGPDDSVPVVVVVGDQGTGMTDRIRESLTEGTERRREATAQLWILLLNSGTLLGTSNGKQEDLRAVKQTDCSVFFCRLLPGHFLITSKGQVKHLFINILYRTSPPPKKWTIKKNKKTKCLYKSACATLACLDIKEAVCGMQ